MMVEPFPTQGTSVQWSYY